MIILKRPIITEKSMKLSTSGLYSFEVAKNVNKLQVASEVASRFKVDVLSVKIVNVKGEVKSQRRVRKTYQMPGMKKALVQLKKGQKIALFENQSEIAEEEVTVTSGEGEPVSVKEKKGFLRGPKVKIERGGAGAAPSTQRKVITGK